MAVPSVVDVTPTPGPPMPRLECAVCGRTYSADRRPDPAQLDPWLAHHGAHDPTIHRRAEELWTR